MGREVQTNNQQEETYLTFPCLFPIKIMAEKHSTLRLEIVDIVQMHAPDFMETMLVERESRAGKYLSLTVTINAHSKAQLDALYQALTSHSKVKAVL